MVSAFERVHGIDISHDDRSHPNLTVFQLENGPEGATRLEEILRNPTFDLFRVNIIPRFVVRGRSPFFFF